MNIADVIKLVKADLQRVSVPEGDDYLTMLIMSAREEIEGEGIELTDSWLDTRLVVSYASYLYSKRKSDAQSKTVNTTEMPRHLRYAMNNRLFKQKAGDNGC